MPATNPFLFFPETQSWSTEFVSRSIIAELGDRQDRGKRLKDTRVAAVGLLLRVKRIPTAQEGRTDDHRKDYF